MLNRREFLGITAASAIGAVAQDAPLFAAEKSVVQQDINTTLQKIITLLRAEPTVAKVDEHLVDSPAKGLVQWQWAHFRPDIDMVHLPQVEEVNRQLVDPMQKVINMPGSGLHALFHEGFMDGKIKDVMSDYDSAHREMVFRHYRRLHPNHFRVQRFDRTIQTRMDSMRDMQWPRQQQEFTSPISPLTRFGVGYALARCNPSLRFLPAEDTDLDAKAAEIEKKYPEDSPEYRLHVLTNRNTEFVRRAAENPDAISHLLVGYNHRLQQAIAERHAKHPDKKLSYVVVWVKGIQSEPSPL